LELSYGGSWKRFHNERSEDIGEQAMVVFMFEGGSSEMMEVFRCGKAATRPAETVRLMV